MEKFDVIIIGGGAAGMTAAISARRNGRSAIICEKLPRLGKKILASGGGRCNLTNDNLSESHYNRASRNLVKSVFAKFGRVDILSFFKDLGLELYSENGRIFPVTNQSSSVLKVLEIELKRLSIPIEFNFEAVDISYLNECFIIKSKAHKQISSAKLILAGGGKTYPALGSDGSCYRFAKRFGHNLVEPVPTAVPLVVKDRLCHIFQGQKIRSCVKSVIDGEVKSEAEGELLFAKYGLSGTAILDISDEISEALNRHKKSDVFVSIDMMPFMPEEKLRQELSKRFHAGIPVDDMLVGMLPNKMAVEFRDLFLRKDIDTAISALKHRRFKVDGTRGWNEAEFTNGGIDAREILERTLESKLKNGLYFAGEMLDVHGKRGGYNLAWAWASGFIAGACL